MPPRHTYWTIILEGKATAFRAHMRDELMPTFRQLQGRHPDIAMMWFARGRLWQSPDEEREAFAARRPASGPRRGPDWRPGGAHKDPRDRFKVPRDEKRRRFAAKLRRDHTDKPAGPASERPIPTGPRRRPATNQRSSRPPGRFAPGGNRRKPGGGRNRGGGSR